MVEAARALFGIETEYAVSAVDAHDSRLPLEGVVRRLCERAAARPHLLGNEAGIFLPNGGRFYVDVGSHPEYASPETTNPWDAVRYALAGDRLVGQLAHEVAGGDPTMADLVVRKGNTDYASDATWASHENFLYRRSPGHVHAALIPHLVSRIVFTGAGGFDPFDGTRPVFVLSPRALFVRSLVASSSPGAIALVDDRNQPLCRGFHRQHVMCGDANQSHLTLFLRIGTTALVVALADAGCAGEGDVRLAEPLEALATVVRDVTLRRPLPLASGQEATALEIQRHYLQQAREHLDRLPAWAGAVCAVWQDTLDRLEHGPQAVADRLDWAIKFAIYGDRAARRRRRWPIMDEPDAEPTSARPSKATASWRAELCEIDLRFGQVYPGSLFDALDRAGVLRHGVDGVHAIDEAVSTPPAEGRARIRGDLVTRLGPHATGIRCGWDLIQDTVLRRTLDLCSPFADTEVWRDLPADQPDAGVLVAQLRGLAGSPASADVTRAIRQLAERAFVSGTQDPTRLSGEHAIQLNNHAVQMREAGRLEDAEWLMRAALAIDLAVRGENHPKVPHRRNNLGSVLLMQGRIAEAREQVTLAWQQTGMRYDLTSARILTVRLMIALVDREPSGLFVGQLKRHLAIQPLPDFADVDRRWHVGAMVEALTSRLDADAVSLLRAIGEAANGDRSPGSLEALPRWCDTPQQSLDAPWPVTPRS